MEICSRERCTGCGACSFVCPHGAIKMRPDKQGFCYPVIDDAKCVGCNLCVKSCHINTEFRDENEKKAYAIWAKDNEMRRDSSSGGAFSLFAKSILEKGGAVFAAGFDKEMNVVHMKITTPEQLGLVRGSKYVQSDLRDTFPQVKKLLEENTSVMFVGTPCQCAALRAYLKNDYNNLLVCDLICHGVPSPMIYKEYISYMKRKYKSNVKAVKFRDKAKSWKCFNMRIDFENGKTYIANLFDDPYHVGFLKNLFLREGCHRCKYARLDRISDITISDFWGYFSTGLTDIDTDKGISLLIVNTKKGERQFNSCIQSSVCRTKPFDRIQATQPCLNKPFERSALSNEFWSDYENNGFDYVLNKYMSPKKPSAEYVRLYKYGGILGGSTNFVFRFFKNVKKKTMLMLGK